jgi:hypothetical protein
MGQAVGGVDAGKAAADDDYAGAGRLLEGFGGFAQGLLPPYP